MVCVLPEPVWPYAISVALYPASSASTRSAAAMSKIESCVESVSKIQSSENSRFLMVTDFCSPKRLLTSTSPRSSCALIGLKRANTPMLSDVPVSATMLPTLPRRPPFWLVRLLPAVAGLLEPCGEISAIC